MKPEVKKIAASKENMDSYVLQHNVIRNTKRETHLNYGKIILFSDLDQDG